MVAINNAAKFCLALTGSLLLALIGIQHTSRELLLTSETYNPLPQPHKVPLNMTGRCFITYELANFPFGRRLGNHIFDTAAVLVFAYQNNMTALLPKGARILLSMDVSSTLIVSDHLYERFVNESTHFKEINNRIYDARTRNLPCNVTLHGFYQSWRYFVNYTHTLRKLITFKPQFMQRAKYTFKKKQEQYFNKHRHFPEVHVGIHARLGFSEYAEDGYHVAPPSYFQKAIRYFEKIHAGKRVSFIISSDNITWCKANIKATNVFYSEAKEGVVDMALQSLCDDTITSLGSFSWWCAFWAGGDHVTYYKDWVTPGSNLEKQVNQTDMFYPSWVGIS